MSFPASILGDALSGIIQDFNIYVVQPLQGFFNQVFSAGGAFFKSFSTVLHDALSGIGQFITQGLQSIPQALTAAGTAILQGLGSVFGPLFAEITSLFSAIPQAITGALSTVSKDIADVLYGVFGPISQAFSAGLSDFGKLLSQIPGGFASFFDTLGKDIFQGLQQFGIVVTSGIDTIGNNINQGLSAFGQSLGAFPKELWNALLTDVIQPVESGVNTFLQGIQTLFDSIVTNVLGIVLPQPATGITDPLALVQRAIGSIIGLGASMGIPMAAAELIQPLKNMGMSQLSAYFWDLADFKSVGSTLLGTITGISIGGALRQALNWIYRPHLVQTDQADRMLFFGEIAQDRWAEIYKLNGWQDKDLDAWQNAFYTTPSIRMLIDLAEVPGIPEDFILRSLHEAGFGPKNIGFVFQYMHRKKIGDEIKKIRAALDTQFEDGFITEPLLRDNLHSLGLTDAEIAWQVFGDKIRIAISEQKNKLSGTLTDFKQQDISVDEMAAGVKSVVQDPELADSIITKAIADQNLSRAKSKKEKKKNISDADILAALDLELFTEQEAEDRLVINNHTTEDAVLLIQLHKAQAAAKSTVAEAKAAEKAARDKTHEETTLALAYAAYLTEAVVARQLPLASFKSQIAGLPIPENRKALIIQEAELKFSKVRTGPIPKPPPKLRESEIYKAWNSELIDETEVRKLLQALNFTDDQINLKLQLNKPKALVIAKHP